MDVLIIGSNGYIGKKLSEFHSSLGDNVLNISSKSGDINPETGDFSPTFHIPSGVSIVYFLAQSPYYRELPKMAIHLVLINTLLAIKTAELCREAGIRTFIYASSGNVYKHSFDSLSEMSQLNRDNWYSLSKIMAEDALNLYRKDFNVVFARIFGVYGPGQKDKLIPSIISRVRENLPIVVDKALADDECSLGMKLSLIHIDDLVYCLAKIACMQSPPQVLNIASPETISIEEIAKIISAKLNLEVSFKVSDKKRTFNLIADTSLLGSIVDLDFTEFKVGIERALEP